MVNVNSDFWTFVEKHKEDDPVKLRLKYHGKASADFDIELAITQIECRKKFGKKLSETLAAHRHWLFPSVLSGEQSTSDRIAQFHASLVDASSSIIDLTAGLGIDTLHLIQRASSIIAVEIDDFKADVLRYNIGALDCGVGKVSVVSADCRDYISECPKHDIAFIDPARRAEDGSRVYALSQCKPDVIEMMPQLSKIASRVIVKMSPMLDITQIFRELPNADRIIALGTETECKELVAIVDFNLQESVDKTIDAVTLRNDVSCSTMAFTYGQELLVDMTSSISTPVVGDFIYDPYPSVMKAAPYRLLSQRYSVKKISNNTHLYFSTDIVADFPGHVYRLERLIPYSSKYIKRLKKDYPKVSVSTRNFDISADVLRAKLGVSDTNALRLYGVTLRTAEKVMLILRPLT